MVGLHDLRGLFQPMILCFYALNTLPEANAVEYEGSSQVLGVSIVLE